MLNRKKCLTNIIVDICVLRSDRYGIQRVKSGII